MYGAGLYVNRPYEHLIQGTETGKSYSLDELGNVIITHQKAITELDTMGVEVAKKAGMGNLPAVSFLGDYPWKTDDAEWFKAHSDRSHRLREAFPEEEPILRNSMATEPPPDWELHVVIRQIEPGSRARLPWYHSALDTQFPTMSHLFMLCLISWQKTDR